MANTSILAAFERMWQHVVTIVSDKSDSDHNHNDMYYTEAEMESKLSAKSDTTHNHDSLYDVKGSAFDSLNSANLYTDNKINDHNTATSAHSDIRDLIEEINTETENLNRRIDELDNGSSNTEAYDCILLKDAVNGYTYVIQMRNGKLCSSCTCQSIEVTTPPNKTTYAEGEELDLTGMVVTAYCADGSTRNIPINLCEIYYTEGETTVTVTYKENGITYASSFEIVIGSGSEDYLSDFIYTDNGDGTYTITDWKGTYNGKASTRCIIPDNENIIVNLD